MSELVRVTPRGWESDCLIVTSTTRITLKVHTKELGWTRGHAFLHNMKIMANNKLKTSPKKKPSREASRESKTDSEKGMGEELCNPNTPEFQAKYAETLTAVGIELEEHAKFSRGPLSSSASIPCSISLRSTGSLPI